MITKFEIFEKKIEKREINIGDEIIWIYPDPEDRHISRKSRDVKYGDTCIITQIQYRKNKLGYERRFGTHTLYVKAKNLETGKPINLLYSSSAQIMPRMEDGNWIEFDRHFKHKFESDINKYNL